MNADIRPVLLIAVLLLLLTPGSAYAACSSPAGAEGELVYNGAYKTVQFCDGSSWISMSGTMATETDPEVGVLTASKWCAANAGGTAIDCTQNAPTTSAAGTIAGALQFRGAGGAFSADDSNLVWDDAANRLGIGSASPVASVDVAGGVRLGSEACSAAKAGMLVWTASTLQLCTASGAVSLANAAGLMGAAPLSATYITQTPDSTLTNEQALSALASGIVKVTTGTGVLSSVGSIDLGSNDASGTLAAGRFPALTGDVTTTAGQLATTIANDAVTYAKIQNVTSGRLLGRASAGAGDAEEISLGSGLSLSGSTLSVSGASSALSSITAATTTNTIDSTNFAQTWNWSTASTQSPLTLTANALTTGSLLSLTSSSASINSTNGLLYVANAGAGTTGTVARIASNSTAGSGLTVQANGNVGIGTTAPQAKLHVLGSEQIGTSGAAGADQAYLNFATQNGDTTSLGGVTTKGWNIFARGNNWTTAAQQNDFGLSYWDGASWNVAFGVDSITRNFGIGTASPTQLLEVRKDQAGSSTIAKVANVSTTSGTQARYDLATGSANAYSILSLTESATPYFEISSGDGVTGGMYFTSGASSTNIPIVFRQSSTERMRVAANGNVGIGTTTPSSLLSVANTGYAQFLRDSAGAPTAADCDAAVEFGRIVIDSTNDRWYVCEGAAGWKYASIGTTGGSGSVSLSAITGATAANTLANGTNAQTWNWALTGATADAFTFGETTAATGGTAGDQSVLKAATLASSTATPLIITNLGNGPSIRVNDETGDTDSTPFIVDASGNVGIGTGTPGQKLEIADGFGLSKAASGTQAGFAIQSGSQSRYWISSHDTGGNFLKLSTGLTPGASIDNILTVSGDTGNVGIRTAAPERALHVVGDGGVSDDLLIESSTDTPSGGGAFIFARSRGTSAAKTTPLANDLLGLISGRAWTGTGYESAADISFRAETDYATTRSGYLTFSTRAAGTIAERMRIASTGNVGVGDTSPEGRLTITGGASSTSVPQLVLNGGTAGTVGDLYVLDSQNLNTGVGYAAKLFGVNVQPQLDASNRALQRTVSGGVTGAAAFYLGADDFNQGGFGVLTTPQNSTAGTVLTERLTVRGNGHVGIGTTSPESLLHVNASDYGIIALGNNDVGGFHITKESSDDSFNIWYGVIGSATNRLRISSTGDVGIGITAPTSLLSVANTGYAQFLRDSAGAPTSTDCDAAPEFGRIVIDSMNDRWYVCEGAAGWKYASIGTAGGSGSVPLSAITAATAANTLANGTNAQVWNWALTGTTADAFTFGETTAATGGTAGDQSVLKAATLASSTATPLIITNMGNGLSFRVNDETGDTDTTPFLIDAAGNVGIGTTSPAAKLHIDGDMLLAATLPRIASASYLTLQSGAGQAMTFNTGGASERMRITSTGSVGIGTASPSATLHVVGSAYIAGGRSNLNSQANSGASARNFGPMLWIDNLFGAELGYNGTLWTNRIFTRDSDGAIEFGKYPTGSTTNVNSFSPWMTIDNNGNVGIGTTTPGTKLHVANGAIRLDNSQSLTWTGTGGWDGTTAGTQIFKYSDNNLYFDTYDGAHVFRRASAAESMRITSSGNVGIGTTSPGSTLDVKGTLRLSGATSGYVGLAPAAAAGSTTYTLPSADGANGQALTTNGSGTLAWSTPSAVAKGLFYKADSGSVAFTRTGNGTVSVKAGTQVEVNGGLVIYSSATAISMPALSAGTDYAIYACGSGSPVADSNLSSTTSCTGGSRKIGGFHYAPGGNAAAQAGGDTTPQINPFSLWDLKWRPSCPDPAGMTLVANWFWADIYLLNTQPDTNGTSKFNVTIADGSSPPRVPAAFGGNGTTAYGSLTWYEASEVMAAYGKALLSQAEFAAAAYGTTENSSGGTDPTSTVLRAAYTSKWGVMLATGNMWVWGRDMNMRWDGANGWNWRNNAGGRGQIYIGGDTNLVAALLGGSWASGALSGSRASYWGNPPWYSGHNIGARGRCDHLRLE